MLLSNKDAAHEVEPKTHIGVSGSRYTVLVRALTGQLLTAGNLCVIPPQGPQSNFAIGGLISDLILGADNTLNFSYYLFIILKISPPPHVPLPLNHPNLTEKFVGSFKFPNRTTRD